MMLLPGYAADSLRRDMADNGLSAAALTIAIYEYTGCMVSRRTIESWRSGARSISDQSALMLQLTFRSLPQKEQTKP